MDPLPTTETTNVASEDGSPQTGPDSSPTDSEMKSSASYPQNDSMDSGPHAESANQDFAVPLEDVVQASGNGVSDIATNVDVMDSTASHDATANVMSESLEQGPPSLIGPEEQQAASADDKDLNQEPSSDSSHPGPLPDILTDDSASPKMRTDSNPLPLADQDVPASSVLNADSVVAVAPAESTSTQLPEADSIATKAASMSPAADVSDAAQNHIEGELQHPSSETQLSDEEVAVRDACIARIKSALLAQESMRVVNVALQHKLSDLFRKRRAEDKNNEPDKSVTDQDQRFANVMTSLKQLRSEYDTMERMQQQVDQEFKAKLQDRKQEFSERSEEFRKYRRQVAVSSENSRTGKSIPLKVVEQLEAQDSRKEAEVAAVRLENIKLRNKLKRHEQTLRQKEELAEGLHLIDFEQLKIENQTYNEKIEERNEELMKLRKKITNVVQVLAHIKEKLQFVQEENNCLSGDLSAIDAQVGEERDQLPVAKQQRDQLRSRNNYLKEKNGLLGNDALLRDFEQRVDEVQDLKSELTHLQELYSRLTRSVKVQQVQTYNQAVLPLILN